MVRRGVNPRQLRGARSVPELKVKILSALVRILSRRGKSRDIPNIWKSVAN